MINKEYTKKTVIAKIKKEFDKEGSIQLQDFMKIDISGIKFVRSYGPSLHSYSFSEFNDKEVIEAISNFLVGIINEKISFRSAKIFIFKRGDYTLMNDNMNESNGIKVIFELTHKWNNEANGYTSFIKDNSEILRILPMKESLTIIKTDNKMKSFVKYVNYKAGINRRCFIEFIYS